MGQRATLKQRLNNAQYRPKVRMDGFCFASAAKPAHARTEVVSDVRTRAPAAAIGDEPTMIEWRPAMKALFDSQSDFVGWISDDQKHIFDINLRWVGYVVKKNAWNSRNGRWVGPVVNGNIHDCRGRPIAWSNRKITSVTAPIEPPAPIKPKTPIAPEQSITPMRPMFLTAPPGGWSKASFAAVFG